MVQCKKINVFKIKIINIKHKKIVKFLRTIRAKGKKLKHTVWVQYPDKMKHYKNLLQTANC
jgi:hypothetical protein